jgi:hypothetical protein
VLSKNARIREWVTNRFPDPSIYLRRPSKNLYRDRRVENADRAVDYAARLAKSDGLDIVDVVGGYSLPDKAFRQSSEARKLDGAVRRFGRLPRRRR